MTSTRRALLVGIDSYPFLNKNLSGAVKDATVMRDILAGNYGFDTKLITDAAADRAGMLSAFSQLVADTNEGDTVVFYYAGHGSQMTDREGDEPSGLDSTLMPGDTRGGLVKTEFNTDITDDEIHLWLRALNAKQPAGITLIIDACHSGTITRDAEDLPEGVTSRGFPANRRPVEDLPESPIPRSEWPSLQPTAATRGDGQSSAWIPQDDNYVLIAGCRDCETSKELKFTYPDTGATETRGALTYFLGTELQKASSSPSTTYREVFERVAASVGGFFKDQHPQIEGKTDRVLLFGTTEIPPMRYVSIKERSKTGMLALGSGAAHGVTPKSRYAVYPQATTNPEGVSPLGEIEVTSVRATTSDARVVSEASPGSITALSRAVLTVPGRSQSRLAVELIGNAEDPDVVALREAISASTLVRLADEGTQGDVRVVHLQPRTEPAALLPQVRRLTDRTWAVVGEDDTIIKPLLKSADIDGMLFNLEAHARSTMVRQLANPDPASVLAKQAFRIELLRRTPDGEWEVAPTGNGLATYDDGDLVGVEVTSEYDTPVFVSLLEIGISGRIFVRHPLQGAETTPLIKGIPLRLWMEEDSLKHFRLPNSVPYIEGDAGPALNEGTEVLKLIVTSVPTNFDFLRQAEASKGDHESVNRGGRDLGPLERLMRSTMGATRDGDEDAPLKPGEDWTTATRTFIVRRRDAIQSDSLRSALSANGVVTAASRVVDAAAPSAAASTSLDVPSSAEYRNVLLKTDANGYSTWHVPSAAPATRDASAASVDRFDIPLGSTESQSAERSFTALTAMALGMTVLKIPIVRDTVSATVESRTAAWEKEHRPYRVRAFTPETYTSPTAPALDEAGWKALDGKRSLLFLHGPFGRSHATFDDLPAAMMAQLTAKYEGRLFAFDHPTLGHEPFRNAQEFMVRIPDGTALDVDIVAHSRGGLVARVLAEEQSELTLGTRKLRIGKVVFVGTPNGGTTFADQKQITALTNQATTILKLIPKAGAVEMLDTVLQVVSTLTSVVVAGLPGLMAMSPETDLLKRLNKSAKLADTTYYAISSDYTPADSSIKPLVAARSMARALGAPNDLVVPADAVWAANGSGMFPVAEHRILRGMESSSHFEYFSNGITQQLISKWLSA